MAQGVLPFKYEEEKKDTGMTGLAGLPVYLDLAFGDRKSHPRHAGDYQIIAGYTSHHWRHGSLEK